MSLGTLGRRVIGRFARYRGRLLLSLLAVVVSTGMGVLTPLLLRAIVDDAIPHQDRRLLTLLCLAMLVMGVAQSLLFVAQGRLANSIGLSVVHDLRMDVYQRVQSMPITFHAGKSGSEVQTRLASDIGGISDVVTFTAQSALGSVTIVVTIGVAMFLLSWPIAVAAIGLTLAMALVNRAYAEKQRMLAVQTQERTSDMMRLAGEHLSLPGVLLGRTLRRWDLQLAQFRCVSRAIADLTTRQRSAGTTAGAIIGVSFAAIPPLVYWMAGGGFTSLTIGTALVLVVLQLQLSGPLQELLSLSAQLRMSLARFDRVFEYLDLGPISPLPAPLASAASRAWQVRLRGVGYEYPDSSRIVLEGIDLDFPAGSSTMIVGSTGSGKSTLGYLIAGLLEPSQGTIVVPEAASSLRSELVMLVPQESSMFNATIRENLLFARPDASEAQLREVLSRLGLDDLITALPDGLDTAVGERGYQLSGGERQRLALARAILSPSGVIVLDEVTSSLDWATARTVQAAIDEFRGERTLIVISHRLSGLRDDDRVVVLAEGRVVETGTHGVLRNASGSYADLLQVREQQLTEASWSG
ncbi:multidrug ABC transporter ATP-binding protein [Rhizocola hellebori]|uniref:Multidrug ABC transporter ATP-binding protein n=1 Tax=Rhizocola hellebori TaxID=1392758 RepID=A0A8J3VGS2_9ACTN|nr:ABC transporter ATP-binding protein [Rhizocola hellebori]GIH05755.1 multidrug ABC transporter ATP-binding protein [Rhizocola hellebori]